MSQQCCARIQIATSRSLELDPEFAGSMFYCVRDPLHEGPHWIIKPSKSESPAPPPCEACGHPQRASREEVGWAHSFNLHDEIRALEAERDGLKHLLAEAVEDALRGGDKAHA